MDESVAVAEAKCRDLEIQLAMAEGVAWRFMDMHIMLCTRKGVENEVRANKLVVSHLLKVSRHPKKEIVYSVFRAVSVMSCHVMSCHAMSCHVM